MSLRIFRTRTHPRGNGAASVQEPEAPLKLCQIRARIFWWWNFSRPGWFKKHFIKREYIALVHDGTPCYMRPADACDELQNADDPKAYTVKTVWMTPHKFDAIPEFQGW